MGSKGISNERAWSSAGLVGHGNLIKELFSISSNHLHSQLAGTTAEKLRRLMFSLVTSVFGKRNQVLFNAGCLSTSFGNSDFEAKILAHQPLHGSVSHFSAQAELRAAVSRLVNVAFQKIKLSLSLNKYCKAINKKRHFFLCVFEIWI